MDFGLIKFKLGFIFYFQKLSSDFPLETPISIYN